jgi:hypothetical protein
MVVSGHWGLDPLCNVALPWSLEWFVVCSVSSQSPQVSSL